MKKHFRIVSTIALSVVLVLVFLSLHPVVMAQTESTPEDNVASVTNFYKEFSAGNTDVFLDLYADSVKRHTYNGLSQDVSAQQLQEVFKTVKQLLPDLNAEIHNIYASGDLVIAEVTWTGTHTATTFFDIPATNKPFTLHTLNVRRFENGKVVEDWDVSDDLVFLQSIGYLPSLSQIQANGPIQ